MKPHFLNQTLLVRTGNGINDELMERLCFQRGDGTILSVPPGATTDGLSIPRAVQNIIPATGGDSWFAGVLHDAAYRGTMEVGDSFNGWLPAQYSREAADNLMLEALEAQGCNWVKRHTIYRALRMFGWSAYQK